MQHRGEHVSENRSLPCHGKCCNFEMVTEEAPRGTRDEASSRRIEQLIDEVMLLANRIAGGLFATL